MASALRDLGAGLAGLLPLAFMLGLSLFRFAQGADRARAIVDAFLVWTIVSYGATEDGFSFGSGRPVIEPGSIGNGGMGYHSGL